MNRNFVPHPGSSVRGPLAGSPRACPPATPDFQVTTPSALMSPTAPVGGARAVYRQLSVRRWAVSLTIRPRITSRIARLHLFAALIDGRRRATLLQPAAGGHRRLRVAGATAGLVYAFEESPPQRLALGAPAGFGRDKRWPRHLTGNAAVVVGEQQALGCQKGWGRRELVRRSTPRARFDSPRPLRKNVKWAGYAHPGVNASWIRPAPRFSPWATDATSSTSRRTKRFFSTASGARPKYGGQQAGRGVAGQARERRTNRAADWRAQGSRAGRKAYLCLPGGASHRTREAWHTDDNDSWSTAEEYSYGQYADAECRAISEVSADSTGGRFTTWTFDNAHSPQRQWIAAWRLVVPAQGRSRRGTDGCRVSVRR